METSAANEPAQLLICSKCSTIPISGGILQCLNGHIICEECYPESDNCSSCQVALDKDTPIKSPGIVVAIIDTMLFSCPFKLRGCTEPDMSRVRMKEHVENYCRFRNSEPGSTTAEAGQTVGGSGGAVEDTAATSPIPTAGTSRQVTDNRKPVICPFCENKRWGRDRKWDAAKHIASIHGVKKGDLGGIFCPFCDGRFEEKKGLLKHVNQHHGNEMQE